MRVRRRCGCVAHGDEGVAARRLLRGDVVAAAWRQRDGRGERRVAKTEEVRRAGAKVDRRVRTRHGGAARGVKDGERVRARVAASAEAAERGDTQWCRARRAEVELKARPAAEIGAQRLAGENVVEPARRHGRVRGCGRERYGVKGRRVRAAAQPPATRSDAEHALRDAREDGAVNGRRRCVVGELKREAVPGARRGRAEAARRELRARAVEHDLSERPRARQRVEREAHAGAVGAVAEVGGLPDGDPPAHAHRGPATRGHVGGHDERIRCKGRVGIRCARRGQRREGRAIGVAEPRVRGADRRLAQHAAAHAEGVGAHLKGAEEVREKAPGRVARLRAKGGGKGQREGRARRHGRLRLAQRAQRRERERRARRQRKGKGAIGGDAHVGAAHKERACV